MGSSAIETEATSCLTDATEAAITVACATAEPSAAGVTETGRAASAAEKPVIIAKR